jgi:hypothetical protein
MGLSAEGAADKAAFAGAGSVVAARRAAKYPRVKISLSFCIDAAFAW